MGNYYTEGETQKENGSTSRRKKLHQKEYREKEITNTLVHADLKILPMIVTEEKKLKEKPLKLSTSDTSSFLPEVSTYELIPSGDVLATSVLKNAKIKKIQDGFASFAAQSKEVHQSIQKKLTNLK